MNRNEGIKFKDDIFRTEHGSIRYRIYEDNIVIFMGSYVDKMYRGHGIFKEMLTTLLNQISIYDIYAPVSNSNVINLFKRMGFEIYNEPIRYWRQCENTTNMYKKKESGQTLPC
jgi:ribosomal protein S18 acetylase RimI-like enzyme